uniref:Mu-conotoxin GIIIB n=1 Tax=Conus geographus TaxID=6491 RepID=CM3B_CONGE|nr:RecName: Full=Mu-conotoxin GIIIB; AltName: Full=Geographutoxin II; Short=GTx-II; AltName: Full=Myotoxin II [Conus geographus]
RDCCTPPRKCKDRRCKPMKCCA